MHALPLGTKVEITHVYRRLFEIRNVPNSGRPQGVRYWAKRELPKPEVGVFIGYRTITDGWIERSEEGGVWRPIEWRLCALVVTGPRKNPVCVPPPYISLALGCKTTEAELDRAMEEAAIEAAELVGPNSPEYEALVERIFERLTNEG